MIVKLWGENMVKIFKDQSALRIKMRTFVSLENIEKAVIRFCKPDGKQGEFSAGVDDSEAGTIIHEFIEGELNASGWWSFWAFVTFCDGRTAAGEAAKVFIWQEGQ